jgi:hypothetical protein
MVLPEIESEVAHLILKYRGKQQLLRESQIQKHLEDYNRQACLFIIYYIATMFNKISRKEVFT